MSEINDETQPDEVQPDGAEATDGTTLGEEIGDDIRPGTVGFPPTTPFGVGASGSIQDAHHVDSVQDRSEREAPEALESTPEAIRLTDPASSGEPGEPHLESELIGDDVPATGLVSPEEAAMREDSDK